MEKISALILDIILCLFSILFLIFAITAYRNYYLDTNLIKEYKENWEKGPIIDIKATKSECPEGYEKFISNEFPGNGEGCDCTKSKEKVYEGKLFNEQCEALQIADGCQMVFKKENLHLKTWRGQKLCVLRMKKSFWNLKVANNTCGKGMKKCGLLDNFNNTLCVNSNETCPINEIMILPSSTKIDDTEDFYTTIKLNNDFNLYFTNKENNNQIIVEIEARSKPICTHPYEAELGQNFHPLNSKQGPDNCTTQIEGSLIDSRFEPLDTQSLSDFYTENSVTQRISKLPLYPQPSEKDKASLYKINYFGWNKKCFNFDSINPNSLLITQSTVDMYARYAYYLAAVSVMHFSFVLVSVILYKMILEKMRVSFLVVFIIDLNNVILIAIMIYFGNYIYKGTNALLAPYKIFIENKCGDKITNGVMELTFSGISRVNGFIMPIFILSGIEVLYVICFYVIYGLIY